MTHGLHEKFPADGAALDFHCIEDYEQGRNGPPETGLRPRPCRTRTEKQWRHREILG